MASGSWATVLAVVGCIVWRLTTTGRRRPSNFEAKGCLEANATLAPMASWARDQSGIAALWQFEVRVPLTGRESSAEEWKAESFSGAVADGGLATGVVGSCERA